MKRPLSLIAVAAMTTYLAGCAEFQAGIDLVKERSCDDDLQVRFARVVLFDHLSGKATGGAIAGTGKLGFDCDGDGAPDNLGSWTAP